MRLMELDRASERLDTLQELMEKRLNGIDDLIDPALDEAPVASVSAVSSFSSSSSSSDVSKENKNTIPEEVERDRRKKPSSVPPSSSSVSKENKERIPEEVVEKKEFRKDQPRQEESRHPVSSTTQHSQPAVSAGMDYEAAWALLQPKKSTNFEALSAYLDELAVDGPKSMKYLEKDHVEHIGSLLKMAAKKEFLEIFHSKTDK
jgi:hypothetical protein